MLYPVTKIAHVTHGSFRIRAVLAFSSSTASVICSPPSHLFYLFSSSSRSWQLPDALRSQTHSPTDTSYPAIWNWSPGQGDQPHIRSFCFFLGPKTLVYHSRTTRRIKSTALVQH